MDLMAMLMLKLEVLLGYRLYQVLEQVLMARQGPECCFRCVAGVSPGAGSSETVVSLINVVTRTDICSLTCGRYVIFKGGLTSR